MPDPADALEKEITKLTRLVAVIGTYEKPQREQIRILASAGLAPKEIASLIGTTGGTVRTALAEMRKKGKARKKKPR